ncbi:MAG: PD40 domain-containing protein [Candidatus Hydrogenedentes bacterium]|nr:PD40 domain-containing protein [Candidatus Hydrogenedentota bacterium]
MAVANKVKGLSGDKALYLLDLATGTHRRLWQGRRAIEDVLISPSAEYVAIRESETDDLHTPVLLYLRVLNNEGNSVLEVADVYRFAWCPDGKFLAYITGRARDGRFTPTGVWIYEVGKAPGSLILSDGAEVSWAEFDGMLYILAYSPAGPVVYKYSPSDKRLSETNYHGIWFSRDGKYYYFTSNEGGPFRLYLRESNEDITGNFEFLEKEMWPAIPRGWLDNSRLVFPAIRGANCDYVFDCDSGKLWRIRYKVIGAPRNEGELIVLDEKGKVAKVRGGSLKPITYDEIKDRLPR